MCLWSVCSKSTPLLLSIFLCQGLCGPSLFLVQNLEAHHSDWAITTEFLHRTFTAEALLCCKSGEPWLKATKPVARTTPKLVVVFSTVCPTCLTAVIHVFCFQMATMIRDSHLILTFVLSKLAIEPLAYCHLLTPSDGMLQWKEDKRSST